MGLNLRKIIEFSYGNFIWDGAFTEQIFINHQNLKKIGSLIDCADNAYQINTVSCL